MNGRAIGAAVFLAVALAAGAAQAQYSFNPANPDEQGLATRYFGVVKDEAGKVVPDATIVINHAFTFAADETGRYSGYVTTDETGKAALVGCAKPGYAFVRTNQRPGVTGKSKWVQADCFLRPKG